MRSSSSSSSYLLREEIILKEDGELVNEYEIISQDDYGQLSLFEQYDEALEHDLGKRGEDYSLDGYIMSCNHTMDMYPDKVIRIISPFNGRKQYPAGLACEWEIMGREECKPVITCETLDLRQSSDCTKDAVVITDGTGGEKSFCGPNLAFSNPFKPRNPDGIYLYVEYRTGDSTHFDRLYKGISCHVRCHKSARAKNQKELPEGEQPKEEYTVRK